MSVRATVVRTALSLSLLLLASGCSSLEPQHAPDHPPASPSPVTVETVAVEIVFTDREIQIIRGYYETDASAHGKGKKGHKGLPPGIAKNVQRGKPMPPGIAKKFLPDDLRRALPPPPVGYERFVIAGKVLLVELATQVVRDVLEDVLFA